MNNNEHLNPKHLGDWGVVHPSNKQFRSAPPERPLKDPTNKIDWDYSSVNGLAMARTVEKHAHEISMVKDLLVTIMNALDLQQHTLDDIYEMLDVYVMGKEDE